MKHLITLFLLLSLYMSGTANSGAKHPEWFRYFSDSFLKINKTYNDNMAQNQSIRESCNFKPKLINLSNKQKISFSVEGLEFIYLSFENYDGRLTNGNIYNPCFIDADGNKHQIEFVNQGVVTGRLRKETTLSKKKKIMLRSVIYKLECKKSFVKFEAECENMKANVHVDVASDFIFRQKASSQWERVNSNIIKEYPSARKKDGLVLELNANISKISLREKDGLKSLVRFYHNNTLPKLQAGLKTSDSKIISTKEVYKFRQAFVQSQKIRNALVRIETQPTEPIQMAITDCQENFKEKYGKGAMYLSVLDNYISQKENLVEKLKSGDLNALEEAEEFFQILDEALLANPLLDFDEIMLIKRDVTSSRKRMPKQFGFPSLNSHNNTRINEIGGEWHNTVSRLTDLRGEKKIETVVDAKDKKLITDLELDFNREHILFSMENDKDLWHLYETGIKGDNLLCLTPDSLPDVNHFDACYLPNGDVVFTSDATYQGLPCEGGSRPMSLLYVLDRKTGKIRQLTYEQDSDFSPAVLNNGRLMYLRWEYSDLAHYFSRILMSCNPDGTAQMEYYGSNSYFPNTYIYARPLPNHSTKVVGIVGGHHGISRSGRLIIVDPSQGRSEADGMVLEIPHRGRKVEPIIKDQLVAGVWPQFIHPYPLNDKYFLVSAKMDEKSLWGVYLVDVFDNMTLIKEIEGSGLFDPIPVRKELTPPIIPSRIREGEKEANVFIADIYVGDGLKNIPKGSVKSLRLFAYHYAHISTGGHQTVGVESSWDIKRVLGTVPVEPDGSAMFKVPANTPIAIQPLDSAGRALQIMRSWFVGMPGENVSCIGCHERTSQVPPNMFRMASRRPASAIKNWQGGVRPFSFRYEVQPVLDKYCVSCHNGKKQSIPDFTKQTFVDMTGKQKAEYFFDDKAYMSLHPYVRRPGPESDIHMFNPMEYSAGTSELIQLLQRGHHGVEMEQKDWEKLYAWIDLNAPHRGKWSPPEFRDQNQDERRKCLNKRYANLSVDPEAEYDSLVAYMENQVVEPVKPVKKERVEYVIPKLEEWPFGTNAAKEKQNALLKPTEEFDLGDGQSIRFLGIPSGKFVKGNPKGYADERNPEVVEIKNPFLMSECEITNAQFALFDPSHDSRFIDQQWKDHTTPGYAANLPEQPVIRVSYDEAIAFCQWLSEKLGRKVFLPNENQWEWACRAGTSSDFWFGPAKTDFGEYENLSDREVRKFAVTGVNPSFIGDENPKMPYYAFIPRENSVSDGNRIVAPVGGYKPNVWGLYDMHGNVAEWTTTSYRQTGQTQDQFYNEKMKVVKGGSWRDRPKKSKAGSKRYYLPYQKVFNVGFRVVIE